MSFVDGLKGSGTGTLPLMLQQSVEMRDQVPEGFPQTILLFQCSAFLETFGEDAERLSRLLGITMTHTCSKDFATTMAGMPVWAADGHIQCLLNITWRDGRPLIVGGLWSSWVNDDGEHDSVTGGDDRGR